MAPVERIQQDLIFLLNYLDAVEVPDFKFVRSQTELIIRHIDEATEIPLRQAA